MIWEREGPRFVNHIGKGWNSSPALLCAVSNGSVNLFNRLYDAGAAWHFGGDHDIHHTPLLASLWRKRIPMIERILQEDWILPMLCIRDQQGLTPLEWARKAEKWRKEQPMVKLLEEAEKRAANLEERGGMNVTEQ
jgi:hypothetical protein